MQVNGSGNDFISTLYKASQFALLDDVVDKAIGPDRSSRRW